VMKCTLELMVSLASGHSGMVADLKKVEGVQPAFVFGLVSASTPGLRSSVADAIRALVGLPPSSEAASPSAERGPAVAAGLSFFMPMLLAQLTSVSAAEDVVKEKPTATAPPSKENAMPGIIGSNSTSSKTAPAEPGLTHVGASAEQFFRVLGDVLRFADHTCDDVWLHWASTTTSSAAVVDAASARLHTFRNVHSLLVERPVYETTATTCDEVLIGLLGVASSIVASGLGDSETAVSLRSEVVAYLLRHCLFAAPRGNNSQAPVHVHAAAPERPKCLSPHSRRAAFTLLRALAGHPACAAQTLEFVEQHHTTSKPPSQSSLWSFDFATMEKSATGCV